MRTASLDVAVNISFQVGQRHSGSVSRSSEQPAKPTETLSTEVRVIQIDMTAIQT